jgi:glycosyltransferase involved in cell wall biosynthesis
MNLFKKPLISIITPSWNREKFLEKLANSLLIQKFKNFEWIVGNDGSTDRTDDVIRSIAKRVDFKIIYINSSLRIGKAALDNIMLEHVSGEYVSRCDSDDFFLPDAMENISILLSKIPKDKIKDYVGIYAQNVDTFNNSQTFNDIPKEDMHVIWEDLYEIIKGDGTIVERFEILKGNKYLEVDFLISESSLLTKLYKGKKFILTPKILKIMDRTAKNSVSFGKKFCYTRGSAHCIAQVETLDNFKKHSLASKIKTIINFWRYSIHGDINFLQAKNMLEPLKKNILYSLLYLISWIICVRDNMLDRVEKTHIEFMKNINNKKIIIENLN